ncbi:general substrate transporter [Aspergillus heterothallicus]
MDQKDTTQHIEQGQEAPKPDNGQSQAGDNQTVWQVVWEKRMAVLYCLCLSLGPIAYGFDMIIISLVTAMPAFQLNFGDPDGSGMYILPAMWLSLWTSMISVGVMAGALATGYICDHFGSRIAVLLGCLVSIAGAMVCTFSDHSGGLELRRVVFLIGKMVLGLGLGFMLPASQTYISEVSPMRVRGPLLSSFTMFVVIGQVIAVVSVFTRTDILGAISYQASLTHNLLFAIEAVPAVLTIICATIAPESPTTLLRASKHRQATAAYARLYPDEDCTAGVQRIQDSLDHERAQRAASQQDQSRLIDCFRGTDFRRTRIVIWANMLQSFVGVAMIANAAYFMQLGGLSAKSSLSVITASLCLAIPAILISWYAMSIMGWRTILLWSTGVIAVLWFATGVAGCFPGSSTALWAVGILIVVVNFFFGLGVGSVYPVISGATSTLRLRAKAQSIGFFAQFLFSWVFTYAVPYMYSTDEANLGGKVGFIFGGLSALAFAVLFVEVPEIRGRTVEELDWLFERRIPTRGFVGLECGGASGGEGESV